MAPDLDPKEKLKVDQGTALVAKQIWLWSVLLSGASGVCRASFGPRCFGTLYGKADYTWDESVRTHGCSRFASRLCGVQRFQGHVPSHTLAQWAPQLKSRIAEVVASVCKTLDVEALDAMKRNATLSAVERVSWQAHLQDNPFD